MQICACGKLRTFVTGAKTYFGRCGGAGGGAGGCLAPQYLARLFSSKRCPNAVELTVDLPAQSWLRLIYKWQEWLSQPHGGLVRTFSILILSTQIAPVTLWQWLNKCHWAVFTVSVPLSMFSFRWGFIFKNSPADTCTAVHVETIPLKAQPL